MHYVIPQIINLVVNFKMRGLNCENKFEIRFITDANWGRNDKQIT